LAWPGPEGTFFRDDGSLGRWADTRPFWQWRFAQILAVERFDITVQKITVDSDGLFVVDFHEVSSIMVRNADGDRATRVADLDNRNWWRRTPDGFSIVNGAEPHTRRTLEGVPIDDAHDPIGFAAWAAHQQRNLRVANDDH
jgi:hypothetical protein